MAVIVEDVVRVAVIVEDVVRVAVIAVCVWLQ